ncbi:glycosyltransferase [Paenibacillus sp. HB172176]|uniref:glycosyltransferase n=1 Tax=Paenibacillus sp. HB172176 TaxID=2493690 RepID=UPI00143B882C|nr:glycosyltransferase [Paenibacillus sp. HB172176]
MRIKVSVIVPVYNAELYLPRCIESLLNQTLRECEFIFVNDGSADGSAAMIAGYAVRDKRIRLLEQQNGGVSAARNSGLDAAGGEYIGFVDADDYVAKAMFESLYDAAVKDHCDIVVSNIESEQDGGLVVSKHPFPTNIVLDDRFIRERVLPLYVKSEEMNAVWNKLYRKSILENGKIRFPHKVALGEDGQFNMHAFGAACTMKYLDYAGYRYCETAGSATRDLMGKDYFGRAVEVYHSALPPLYSELMDKEEMMRLKSIKLIQSLLSYIHVYFDSKTLTLHDKRQSVKRMLEKREVAAALPLYEQERQLTAGPYQKMIMRLIHRRSLWGLYVLTSYSRLRNSKKRGNRA